MTPVTKAVVDDIKLNPALRGLSPQCLEKIKKKERARIMLEMTMPKDKMEEIEQLGDLLHMRFFSSIVNYHNTLRKGKAVPKATLETRIAQGSGKAKQKVEQQLKLFMQICPEVFTLKMINKVEQVLGNYNKVAPEFDAMEQKIQEALKKRKLGQ